MGHTLGVQVPRGQAGRVTPREVTFAPDLCWADGIQTKCCATNSLSFGGTTLGA